MDPTEAPTAMRPTSPDAPSIDMIVNNHNYGAFVAEAVESALRQTHPRVRVVVVDDGSTDASRQILKRYESRVELVLKENGGQASALNAGLERCSGDVVIFLDADDLLHPEAAERVAAVFAADSSLVKAQFRMRVVDREGRPTGALKPPLHLPLPSGDLRAAELAYPFDIPWAATSANAFRRTSLERILPIPESEYPVTGADWHLVHLSALLGPVVSLGETLASYRVHGGNDYEPRGAELDLAQVRKSIGFARSTSAALLALADALDLPRPARILSIADLARRLVSLRLEPNLHPVATDRVGRLLLDSIGAARRRTNVSAAMKAALIIWFAAMASAPRPWGRKLATLMLFPERRGGLDRLLGKLQRNIDAEAGNS